MLASAWNLKCHRIKLDVKWLDGTGGLIVIRGCNNTPPNESLMKLKSIVTKG